MMPVLVSWFRVAPGSRRFAARSQNDACPGFVLGFVLGFSLHAGVAAEAHEGQKLERRCRCIARPAISEKRLSLWPQGRVRYQLKTPWKNGTTHVEFEPETWVSETCETWVRVLFRRTCSRD